MLLFLYVSSSIIHHGYMLKVVTYGRTAPADRQWYIYSMKTVITQYLFSACTMYMTHLNIMSMINR